MEITWREIAPDDMPAWAALWNDAEAVDHTGEHFDEGDLKEEFADPTTGPEDRIAGWVGGRMVASAGVRPRGAGPDSFRIDTEGVVHPQWRGQGLGSHLVDWTVERAGRLGALLAPGSDLDVRAIAYLNNQGQVELLEAQGFEAVNWSAVMRVVLSERDIPEPRWPDGVSVYPFAPEWSAPMLAAHNAAFQDHWGFVDWTPQMWHQWGEGSKNFRPEASWVVVDEASPDLVIGYVQTSEFEAYEAATGKREAFLAKIGVRREQRGRGLATALLRHALREYQRQGYDESSLDVDTNNPTGAYGLYERAGYEVETRAATFRLRPETSDAGGGS